VGSYGRNFDFRTPPRSEDRQGRFAAPATGTIPIGAPVIADLTAGLDEYNNQIVKLATGAQAPLPGLSGIAVYEYAPAAFAGFDPWLTTYSDLDVVPPTKALQVVSGPYVKAVFTDTNTPTFSFLNTRTYNGRVMVAGLGATPTVAVGNFITPGVGTDAAGYWAVTAVAADAWAVVTYVDAVRQNIEARFLF
jgi:hypothetical protein